MSTRKKVLVGVLIVFDILKFLFVGLLIIGLLLPDPTPEQLAERELAAAEKQAEKDAKAEAKAQKRAEKEAQKLAEIEAKEKAKEEARLAHEAEVAESKAEKEAERELAREAKESQNDIVETPAAEVATEEPDSEVIDSPPVNNALIPVELYRVVDGDTVHVINANGETLKLRLLLIDTPETVHPNKPVEPFGPEASARLTEFLTTANQLHIEYDDGDQTDHYGRHLVYIYADGINAQEVLLEEGLARVGYVYEQQRHLDIFRAREQYAKDNMLGIWSIPGYVNVGGEGFNSEDLESEVSNPEPQPESQPSVNQGGGTDETYNFKNCTELREVFPEGVASDHPAYKKKMDRDEDNWACEVNG